MDKPLVSIVTVTYNAENHLETTIQSIAGQTYSNIEYIVVDGQSTDRTPKIIQKYQSVIAKWISEPDDGLYDAMNKGLRMANGEYIWFINAGDSIRSPETLDKIFDEQHKPADVYYGQTMVINEAGNEIGLRRLKPHKPLTWKSFIWGQLVSHQAFIARCNALPEYRLKFKYSADTDWQIRILKNADSIKNTNLVLCNFLDGGRSKKTILPSLFERFKILVSNYGVLPTLAVHVVMVPRFLWFYLKYRRF